MELVHCPRNVSAYTTGLVVDSEACMGGSCSCTLGHEGATPKAQQSLFGI